MKIFRHTAIALGVGLAMTAAQADVERQWLELTDAMTPEQVVADLAGDALVVGSDFNSGASRFEYITAKYAADGSQQWIRGFGDGDSFPGGLAVDAAGDVYVTGYAYRDGTSPDIVTVKYSSDGLELWSRAWDGGAWDEPVAIHAFDSGGIVLTGHAQNGPTQDIVTLRYDNGGNLLWSAQYDGPSGFFDRPWDMTADAAGNVYVVGEAHTGSSTDLAVIKYAADGAQAWVYLLDNQAAFGDAARSVAVDAGGFVYVGGIVNRGAAVDDATTLKLDPDGQLQWVRYWDSGSWDRNYVIGLDAAGNAYVTGETFMGAVGEDYNIQTLKYTNDGELDWVRIFNGKGDVRDDTALAMQVAEDDRIYVFGGTFHGNGYDYVVIQLDPDGTLLDQSMVDLPDGGFQHVERALTVSPDGGLYAVANANGFDFVSGLNLALMRLEPVEPAGPDLSIGQLISLHGAEVRVSGLFPGERVRILSSTEGVGNGPCLPSLGGLCVDLISPQRFGNAPTANADGIAMMQVVLPPMTANRSLSFQAVVRRGTDGVESVKTGTLSDVVGR